jgi:hypothetical protein
VGEGAGKEGDDGAVRVGGCEVEGGVVCGVDGEGYFGDIRVCFRQAGVFGGFVTA